MFESSKLSNGNKFSYQSNEPKQIYVKLPHAPFSVEFRFYVIVSRLNSTAIMICPAFYSLFIGKKGSTMDPRHPMLWILLRIWHCCVCSFLSQACIMFWKTYYLGEKVLTYTGISHRHTHTFFVSHGDNGEVYGLPVFIILFWIYNKAREITRMLGEDSCRWLVILWMCHVICF